MATGSKTFNMTGFGAIVNGTVFALIANILLFN